MLGGGKGKVNDPRGYYALRGFCYTPLPHRTGFDFDRRGPPAREKGRAENRSEK